MGQTDFFEELREQSRIKTTIVTKYFYAWAKVMAKQVQRRSNRLAYVDLFAGPGRYEDGSKSTPLIVLETAIKDPSLRQKLVTVFNDKNPDFVQTLKEEISSITGIETLTYAPQVTNGEVGNDVVDLFEGKTLIPTLCFVDPWGYQGLSLRLIQSVLKDYGCECIFFFNYNRINAGITNETVHLRMDELFGSKRAEDLRNKLDGLRTRDRETAIIESMSEALAAVRGRFVLPFCFRNESGSRTSHYLIFVTKHFQGYNIMKEIMAKESTSVDRGASWFGYCQADITQPVLFELNRPIEDLANLLLQRYAGSTKRMIDIYMEHSVGRPYLARDYKNVLAQMEQDGLVRTDPPASKRRNGTFGDNVRVTFPPKED